MGQRDSRLLPAVVLHPHLLGGNGAASYFAVWLGWFPVGLSVPIGMLEQDVTLFDRLSHVILPALTLSLAGMAPVALHTREKLMNINRSDYMLYAWARGEGEWTALRRHGLRNLALPAVTLQFASFAELFGGSVLAEQVFSYPASAGRPPKRA